MAPKIYDPFSPRRKLIWQHQAYVRPLSRWENYWLVAYVLLVTATVNVFIHTWFRICG